jgi:pimeloyl-ACP methyl ester carboxylesterase
LRKLVRLPSSRPGVGQSAALDFGRDRKRTPIICLHGLTRNARDFDDLIPVLAADRNVAALTFRGRGVSDYDPDFRAYHPFHYRNDLFAALDTLCVSEAVLVGTSLGGIVSMLAAEARPDRVKAVVINDVGPALAPEGIARIAGYVGRSPAGADASVADLDAAAAAIRAINEVAFPGRDDGFWRAFAARTFRQRADARWVLDYDPAIARALAEVGAAPDLWAAFASLKSIPTLLIRGALSDLLSPQIVADMRAVHPGFDYCEVASVGHAPTLAEPEALSAISAFLAKLD